MDSKVEVFGNVETREKRNPNVHFIAAPHTRNSNNEKSQLEKGNLEAHVWPSKVAEELKVIRPAALIIDSLESSLFDYNLNMARRRVWVALPGHPGDINGRGEVLVVMGDSLETTGAEKNIYKELAIVAAVSIGLPAALAYEIALWRSTHVVSEESKPKTSSRRNFLKRAAGAVALAGGGLLLKPDLVKPLASETPEVLQSFAQQFALALQSLKPLDKTWVDGRTALMIAKAIDMQRNFTDFGLDSSDHCAVIAGTAHIGSEKYLSDIDARREAIRRYAAEVLEALDKELKIHTEWKISQEKARYEFLDYLVRFDVVKVTDPVVKHTDKPDEILDENIKHVGTFYSKEVEAAIATLRTRI